MSSLKNEAIQGNLSTSCDITAGGHLNVHGNSVFDHNVVIKGWLDAKNIKGPCKGLYASLDALKEAYPRPMPGWYALVGNTLPADVYRSDGGEWVAIGEQGGEVNLYLDQLEKDVANLDDEVASIEENIENLNANTGVDEYPAFSESKAYAAGDVVNYNGRLYKFTSDHAVGAWTGTDVEGWSLKRSDDLLRETKEPASHGNKYIREMYLSGDGLDKSHAFVLSRISRNHPTYKWAVYVKDVDLNKEYYVGFNAFSSEPEYIDNIVLTGGSGCHMSAIINWDEIEDGAYLNELDLPLANVFSLERNPYINSYVYSKNIVTEIDRIGKETDRISEETDDNVKSLKELKKLAYGSSSDGAILSGTVNKEITFSLNFSSVLPASQDNRYKITLLYGGGHVKPRTFGLRVNGTYYTEDNHNLTYISDYEATVQISGDDTPIETFYVSVGVVNQVSVGEVCFVVSALTDDDDAGLLGDVRTLLKDVTELKEKVTDTRATVESLYDEVFGDTKSSELSGEINMTSTFSLIFAPVLPESSDHKYRVEIVSGQEHIKPRTFGCVINGSYYIESNKNITYESDYSATLQVAEKDTPINAFYVQVGVPNQVSAGSVTVRVSNIGTNGIADEVESIKSNVESIKSDVTELKSNVEEINERIDSIEAGNYSFTPSLHICKNIYCVVGDKIQLYYDSFVHHIGDYSLNIVCNKGRNYKRYWEYTPTSSDVGTVTMTIQLLDIDGKVIGEKQVSIVTKEAVNKPSQTNVLFVGDSLMMSGQQPIEVSRRLKGTIGAATSPSPLALSNFCIKGRKVNTDQSVGWEGTGGWTWDTYLSSTGNPGIRFTASDITDVRPGTIYTIQGFTQKVEISEINTTENTVFGIYYGKGDIYNNPELLPQTGSLTRTSGQGQETVNYTSAVVETFQPFWNYDTDQFDISSYVDKYLDGHVEYICILLGSNSIIGMNPYMGDIANVLNQAKELIAKIHAQFPDAIICVGTEPLKSQNGGTGTSYAASGASGSFLIPSWNYKYHKLNDAYRTLEEDETFSQYVKVVDLCAQTDSEYAFNYTEVDVNTRVATDKERRGTDGVHPNNQGYWMMADAWFRALLCIE